MNSGPFSRFAIFLVTFCLAVFRCPAEVNQVQKVAEDVYLHEGELAPSGHCNNGLIIFQD
jgi:hypothetical protein